MLGVYGLPGSDHVPRPIAGLKVTTPLGVECRV